MIVSVTNHYFLLALIQTPLQGPLDNKKVLKQYYRPLIYIKKNDQFNLKLIAYYF
jgi:hypothetical protein